MTTEQRTARRAACLVRCYPPTWRERYGDEFTELLIAELHERPRSTARTLDVLRGAILARLASAGLRGHALKPGDQPRASLAALGCLIAVFLTFAVSQWAQLSIDWQWAPPDSPTAALAIKVMTAALLAVVIIAGAAIAPIAHHATRAALKRDGRRLRIPALLCLGGAAILVFGSRHFAQGWPGTGGHSWPGKALIPADIASIAWASTLSITSYWAHPGKLSAFPAGEIAWMVIAPIAISCLITGAAKTTRRLQLSPRLLRYESQLGRAASIAMLAFLGAAATRLFEQDPGPRRLFAQAGAIDLLELTVMAGALSATLAVARRTRKMA